MDLNFALTILGIIAIVAMARGKDKIAEKAIEGISGLASNALSVARHFVSEITKGEAETEKAEEVSDLNRE